MSRFTAFTAMIFGSLMTGTTLAKDASGPEFSKHVAPVLTRYCAGCHNADDAEGRLSLESFTDLQKGGEHGPAVLPGRSESSRLIRVLTGTAQPRMPPEGEPAPSAAEIALLKAWIDGGARGPDGREPPRGRLLTPRISPAKGVKKGITALAWHPKGRLLAVARFGEVRLIEPDRRKKNEQVFGGLPGKVNSLEFSRDGRLLVAATGIAGLTGQAVLFDASSGQRVREFDGHRDIIYSATLSPDGRLLATGSYDRRIILWNAETGEKIRTLEGHNDAVYDVAFCPDGSILASASGDETCKLWQVATGIRLDTLSQPLAEQYAVTFSPNGRYVVAGGADNRIRVWRVVSRKKPKINPLRFARFGHEGAVVGIEFSPDGRSMVSAAEDRSLKLWDTESFAQIHAFEQQPDIPQTLAFAPDGRSFLVGRIDGSLERYEATHAPAPTADVPAPSVTVPAPIPNAPPSSAADREPNDAAGSATRIQAPATIIGAIHATRDGQTTDVDLFRFRSDAGRTWMVEVNAARNKSPLDARIEVLSSGGNRIERVLLRAVRDSYFTFRGKDSTTLSDFRLHNWEEMDLNQYLYCNGEVVRLWLYPRGPDSGFKVYPGNGQRWGYFDTTPYSHPLHEPVYIVDPHPPGTNFIPNGLPVFPVYYENDDDSLRQWGTDSRLTFTAPASAEYLVRIGDARGFHGEDYSYELTVRPARPDFKVTLHGANPAVGAGSGREFHITLDRIDGFEGEVRVDISDVPPGFVVTTPIVIQSGQNIAYGSLNALPDAPQPTSENANASKVAATAEIDGVQVTHDVDNLGEIKLTEKPKLLVQLLPYEPGSTKDHSPGQSNELAIAPGETIMARVRVERNGFEDRVEFGGAGSGRNLPHGVYVDNLGLNGLLIVEGTSERTFFITAADWVPETTRWIHLKTRAEDGQTSRPVLFHVRRAKSVAELD